MRRRLRAVRERLTHTAQGVISEARSAWTRAFGPDIEHQGVKIWHRGILVNQLAVTRSIDEAITTWSEGRAPGLAEKILDGVEVRICPGPIEIQGTRCSNWAGWIGNRGEVWLAVQPDMPALVAEALTSLLDARRSRLKSEAQAARRGAA
ncbi:MAG: hypothetical protein ACE366_16690 [Bradymonadia bacterium]